jgi:hypothetical protein
LEGLEGRAARICNESLSLWKNATVLIALVLGLLYTLPNFFGEAPAVQVASVKATHKVDARLMTQVEEALKAPLRRSAGFVLDLNSMRVRLGRYRHPAQGQGCDREGAESGTGGSRLQRRAQPGVRILPTG